MLKKAVALATLASFLVFSCSCIYSWKKTPLVSVKPQKRTEAKISAVQVHSGEITIFSKDPAAKIQGDLVVGTRFIKDFRIEKSKIKQLEHERGFRIGGIIVIVTTDGVKYRTDRIKAEDDSSMTFDAYFPGSIPLADVASVWIRQVDQVSYILCGTIFGIALYFIVVRVGIVLGD